jgi:hypothetical protein
LKSNGSVAVQGLQVGAGAVEYHSNELGGHGLAFLATGAAGKGSHETCATSLGTLRLSAAGRGIQRLLLIGPPSNAKDGAVETRLLDFVHDSRHTSEKR